MTGHRFSIDTNILVYNIDKDAGTRHEQSRPLVDALVDRDCVLTLQALAEFFHAVTRKNKMPVA
jgi:predicted nucleic acid-binding protein